MVRLRQRDGLCKRTLGGFRSLFQLSHARGAIAVHPARAIPRTEQHGQQRIAEYRALQHLLQSCATQHGNIEFTVGSVGKFAVAHRADRVQSLRVQLTLQARYSTSSSAGGCSL